MKYGKEVRKRLDPLMEKYGYELHDENSEWLFYINLKKSYPQSFSFSVEWHMQEVESVIVYNRLINSREYIINNEHYSSKQDLLYKLDNEWLSRIEEALNKQWIKPGIDFRDGSFDEEVFHNYQQYAQEVLSSKDYPFNNINDVRFIINDLLSQKLSYKDFMKKASSVYIKYVLEADNEFNDYHMGDYFGLKRNIYIGNGKKGKELRTVYPFGVVMDFWCLGDTDCLEYGRGFSATDHSDNLINTFESEYIQKRVKEGRIKKLIK